MSDPTMTENLNPDDHAILLALAQVTAGGIEVPLPATADRARVREYVELLGLLPYGLEPAAPSARVKARMLAAVGGPPAEARPAEARPQRSFDEVTLDGSADSDPLDMTFRRVAPVSGGPGWQELKTAATPAAEPEPEPEVPAPPVAAEPESAPEPEMPPPVAAGPAAGPVSADEVTAKLNWLEPETRPAAEPVAAEPVRPEAEPPAEPIATEPGDRQAGQPPPAEPGPAAEPEPPEPLPANVVPIAPAGRPARGAGSWWTPALAAMLALCMFGLTYLAAKIHQQSAIIARLNGELEGLPIEDLSAFHDELDHMKRHFQMVTAVARHAYPMKTVQPSGSGAQIDGKVYVCGNHQRWYLNIQGLEPPPAGEEYNLWFVTAEGMVRGGVIEVRAGTPSEMEAPTLPAGTRGFAVTREQAGTPGDEPAGTMVLLAEESISL